MNKRTILFLLPILAIILFAGNVLPGLTAEISPGSEPPEYRWRHNPFIPLLTPREANIQAEKGGQAAPFENFSLPPDLKLKAVIKSNGCYKAIVGDQLVVPDDLVMGFIVAEIQADRVVLLKNGRVVELSLRSIVNRKENFTIKSMDDTVDIAVHDVKQAAEKTDRNKL